MDAIAEDHLQTEVLSPFLPGTNIQYAFDSTSLNYLKTCPRLYYYIMIEGWTSRFEGLHLRFGIEYHTALENYYKFLAIGCDHEEAVHSTVRELLISSSDFAPKEEDYGKAARYKSRENLVRTVIWYLDKYPAEKDVTKTHILENGKPAVELSFRFELDWGPSANETPPNGGWRHQLHTGVGHQPYLLCGHLDRVVSYHDDLYVMDHKTTTSTPGDYYFDQFLPNNQMSLYTLAGKVVCQSPVKGVIIDCAQIQLEASVFKRGFTMRSEEQTQEWVDDLSHWLRLAEHYATMDYWPQNDTACDKFGGCAFRPVCGKSPRIREPFLRSDFVKLNLADRWNPLKPR